MLNDYLMEFTAAMSKVGKTDAFLVSRHIFSLCKLDAMQTRMDAPGKPCTIFGIPVICDPLLSDGQVIGTRGGFLLPQNDI